jgi:hypothetical protein
MNASAWELLRAVRGPLLLMTFGTLVALNHTDRIDFSRTWPVLIIVYGVMKLLERMVPRPLPPPWQPQAYPQPGFTPEYPQYPPPPQQPQGGRPQGETPQGGTV